MALAKVRLPGVPILSEPKVKFPKPKIMLLDLSPSASDALTRLGFNVQAGTLGTPYKIEMSDGHSPVIGESNLPNIIEQDVIVVDFQCKRPNPTVVGAKHVPDGDIDLWAKCNKGLIDPRSRTALTNQDALDRTLSVGGAIVIFADAKTGIELCLARRQGGRHGRFVDQIPFNHDIWHLVSPLAEISVSREHGQEMQSCDSTVLGRLVRDHLDGGNFTCTLQQSGDEWKHLVTNKFGAAVGLMRCRGMRGTILVLPQLRDKDVFLIRLFTEVLPELAPHLFPHNDRGMWTHQQEYELPKILEIKSKQLKVEQRAIAEIEALHEEAATERATNGWLHDLITSTDSQLVEAVKKALAALGFEKITDVDAERDREGKSRREDLQIHDQVPTLIVDIKGIGGYPSDEDALQADKHASIRMREWNRTDVLGLSIINHQRHLPPLDRENGMPFRQELIDAASIHKLGLVTTWDLYRLIRNKNRYGWQTAVIRPLFYKDGRIEALPTHYQFVGTIEKVWTDKFGVVIEGGELCVGDGIAVEFPIEFEESSVESIYVNDKEVTKAGIGDPAGLMWPKEKPKLREGMRVFGFKRSK